MNHDGVGVRDIGVRGGRIAALGDLAAADAGEIVDAGRAHHPSRRHRHARCISASRAPSTRRTFETGSLAAVMGGVTAVFEMPNTNPLTTERGGA